MLLMLLLLLSLVRVFVPFFGLNRLLYLIQIPHTHTHIHTHTQTYTYTRTLQHTDTLTHTDTYLVYFFWMRASLYTVSPFSLICPQKLRKKVLLIFQFFFFCITFKFFFVEFHNLNENGVSFN